MLFHLTEHCTLECPHCFIESSPNERHSNDHVVREFVRFARSMSAFKIGIAGGEPTEHPMFVTYMNYILKKLSSQYCSIILMTNGRFLLDSDLTKKLVNMTKKYPLFIQVSALRGIYPRRDETIEFYHMNEKRFRQDSIMLIEDITAMENLGRAVGRDWSHLGELYQRIGPMCFNIFSVVRSGQFSTLVESLQWVEVNVRGSFCKPLIAWDGSLYAGETPLCLKLGNILTDTPEQIFENIKENRPCGQCGRDIPPMPY